MIFKLIHGKEIHMLNKRVTFDELIAFVRSGFKKAPKNFSLSYTDTEGDIIAIASQDDL
jgi:hypothetical protein